MVKKRYLAIYSHIMNGAAVFGNTTIDAEGPDNYDLWKFEDIRRFEKQITEDIKLKQVVIINIIRLANPEE